LFLACSQPAPQPPPPAPTPPASKPAQVESAPALASKEAASAPASKPKDPCASAQGAAASSAPSGDGPQLQALSEELIPLVEKVRQVKSTGPVKMSWASRKDVCLYLTGEM